MPAVFWVCFFLVIAAICVLIAVAQSMHTFACGNCGKEFKPKWTQLVAEVHILDEHLIKCPHCNTKCYCKDKGKFSN